MLVPSEDSNKDVERLASVHRTEGISFALPALTSSRLSYARSAPCSRNILVLRLSDQRSATYLLRSEKSFFRPASSLWPIRLGLWTEWRIAIRLVDVERLRACRRAAQIRDFDRSRSGAGRNCGADKLGVEHLERSGDSVETDRRSANEVLAINQHRRAYTATRKVVNLVPSLSCRFTWRG